MNVFIPQPVKANSEMGLLIMPGLLRHESVRIVSESNSADLILYHYSGEGHDFVRFDYGSNIKSVMIDYQDDPFDIIQGDWSFYFKRSTADKKGGKPKRIDYGKKFPVINLPYCVKEKDGRTGFDYPRAEKEFDICCLFDLGCHYRNRNKVVNFIHSLGNNGIKVFTGLVDWHFLKRDFSDEYFGVMSKSKIIVNCNPDDWEGDYRLFEALTTGSLVFCDEMSDKMGFEEDIIWYSVENLKELEYKLRFFLNNQSKLQQLSESAFNKTKQKHISDSRVKFILQTANQ